jgi:FKBP-type peptidyl-prolyl cis-trans isomerase FkpA
LHPSRRPTFVPALALLAVAALGAGCSGSPAAPTSYAAFSRTDIRLGTGNPAAQGSIVTVHYTGWLYDPDAPEQKGLPFDSSLGQDPFSFTLGAGQVIEGWDQGLVGMNVGGLRRLVIPPSMAYGGNRAGVIPPFATLVFDVELLEVE